MLRWCKLKDYESEILAFNNSCAFGCILCANSFLLTKILEPWVIL